MKSHFELSDQQFETEFASLILNPSLFTHEAHLRLAYIHIKKYGQSMAAENICGQIKAFDQHFGDGTKFHMTITVAAVRMMNHFMNKQKGLSFKELIETYPRLIHSFKELIYQHYSFNVFTDSEARIKYLEPDLQEFS
ncbi:hypothetical protein [Fulvivirga lutimaris]|uniref:hypothetical protein n=1 Tax=Fulvivirga lutimaris TaxID=1819566 RepID=UPI0012BD7ED3|nr:hypothetical protein [Fulvivirga lutimaris]MTI40196.1 hypothetical protein [Fulvivirga lutimaris]